MNSNKRSVRRHHRIRLAKQRKTYMVIENCKDERVVGKYCKTPSLCSCSYCTNPRRDEWNKNKSTLQEQIADDAFVQDIKEFVSN